MSSGLLVKCQRWWCCLTYSCAGWEQSSFLGLFVKWPFLFQLVKLWIYVFVCFGASVLGEGGSFCDEHSLDVKSYKRFYCFIFSCLMVLQTACRWQRVEIWCWTLKLVLFVWMASRWCSDQSRIIFTGIKKLSLAAWRANDKTSVFVAAWPNISNSLMDLHCWTSKHQELQSNWLPKIFTNDSSQSSTFMSCARGITLHIDPN